MAEKLPTINYNRTGVGSMGRANTSLPGSLSSSRTNLTRSGIRLAGATVDLIDRISKSSESNDLAVVESSLTEKMSELDVIIAKKTTYSAADLEDMGVKFNKSTTKLGPDGKEVKEDRQIIPAAEVADQVYKIRAREIQAAAYSNAPNAKSLVAIKKRYATLYEKGVDGALNHQLNHAIRTEKIKVATAFDAAIKSGNEQGAKDIANAAFESGTWSEAKYEAERSSISDRVRTNIYMQAVNMTDNTPDLEYTRTMMTNDTQLSIQAKKALNGTFQSKINRLDAAAEKKAKENKLVNSATKLIQSTDYIRQIGAPLPADEIVNMGQGMTATDRKALATYNNSLYSVTDPETFDKLAVQVRSISIPDGTTVAQRRERVMQDLIEATESKQINGKDFLKLTGMINVSQEFQTASPAAKRTVDMIWQDLTGGSKNMISSALSLGGIDTLTASKAEFDLLRIIDQSPVGFDPAAWWDKNRTNYYTESVISNLKILEEQTGFGFVVMQEGSRYKINRKETIKAMKAKIKSGRITQAEANAKLMVITGASDQVTAVTDKDKKVKDQFSQ